MSLGVDGRSIEALVDYTAQCRVCDNPVIWRSDPDRRYWQQYGTCSATRCIDAWREVARDCLTVSDVLGETTRPGRWVTLIDTGSYRLRYDDPSGFVT